MVAEKVTVVNKSGIHARPAGELAKLAMKCKSEVFIRVGEKKVNPKSVQMMLCK